MSAFKFSTDRASRLSRLRRFLPRFLNRRRTEHLSARVFQARPRAYDFLSKRSIIITTLVVVVFGALVGIFQFSGLFTITKVSVLRSSLELPLADIETIARGAALGKNIFAIDPDTLAREIRKIHPEIARVAITKNYPHELTVEVFKYPIVAELRSGTEKIYLNAAGYRVSGEKPERDTLILSLGETADLMNKNKPVISAEHLAAIREATVYLSALTELSALSVNFFPTAREAHLKTNKNFDIWLDLSLDYRSQLDKLTAAGNALDLKKGAYEYIDLRVRNKIFYKPKK